jgi:hypothetical protein
MALTLTEIRLAHLAEEGGEIAEVVLGIQAERIAKIAIKALRFGLDEVRAGQELTNRERLFAEIDDFWIAASALGWEPDPEHIMAKFAKGLRYDDLSRKLGTLTGEAGKAGE